MLSKENQKQIALERMQQLGIYKPYVDAFKKKGTVTMFEQFGGYWATAENGEEELENEIRKFEERTGCMVYAVTHEIFEFGECYSFLIISNHEQDEEQVEIDRDDNGIFYPYAWIWNKDVDYCSEYGTIGVQAFGGGMRRIY